MTTRSPSDLVDPFFEHAVKGDTRPAVTLALGLLDRGVPLEIIITDLLAASQRKVGELWQANQLNVTDEHVATGVTQATLHALASATPVGDMGLVAVVCAEGDWHGLAAHMFAEQLRSHGIRA
jgi:methanogenic corrinoid protein MtbC1